MGSNKLVLIIAVLALAGVGCSSKKEHGSSSTSPVADVVLPDPIDTPAGTGSVTSSGGATVTLVPESFQILNTYVGTHPLNNPTNIQLTVDLTADAQKRSYGTIRISYTDNGQRYEGVFSSGTGDNPYLKYAAGNGLKEYHYNYWFKYGGKSVFNGYFQDAYGAVVLVVDDVISQGDAQGAAFVSGSVWFVNFPYLQVQQGPVRKCWFITNGPYNCQAGAVSYKNELYPGVILNRSPAVSYRKLGHFSGLSVTQAFK